MGRFLRAISLFLLVAAVCYTAAMALMARIPAGNIKPLIYRTGNYYYWPGGATWMQFREFDPRQRFDAVIIGSSHAYRGYDPYVFRERGYRVFNLGSNAQTPLNTYWLLKEMLDSTNAPLLIFDVYEGVFQSDGLESTADLTRNVTNNTAAMGMAWSLRDLRALNLISLREVTPHAKAFHLNPGYRGLGFTPKPDSIKVEAGPPPVQNDPLLARQQHFFEACMDLCRQKGITLVVASHYARRDRQGAYHQQLKQYMDSILTGTGVPYLDFTGQKGVDDRNWFADRNHLNITGARIFTEQLVDTLESLGYLDRSLP